MSISDTMLAAVLDAPHEPLRLEEIPTPAPRAGEVLVKVAACGVCHSDLHVMGGGIPFPMPCVLGHEISGTVAALGERVEAVDVGDRVACAFIMPCGTCRRCTRGRDDLCEKFFEINRRTGTLYDGETRLRRKDGTPLRMFSMAGLAEYAVVPATDVFAVPSELDLVASSIIGCAMFTAYGAVRRAADLRVGESVAVIAVGGVGSNIVQLAAALGARRIIAIDISPEKLEWVASLGATDVVDASRVDAEQAVAALTAGEGVDVAFEALGNPKTISQALGMLRAGGRLVTVGLAPAGESALVPIGPLVRQQLRVIGSYGARTRIDMPDLLALVASSGALPDRVVTRRVPFDRVNDIYGALGRGEILGRAVIEYASA